MVRGYEVTYKELSQKNRDVFESLAPIFPCWAGHIDFHQGVDAKARAFQLIGTIANAPSQKQEQLLVSARDSTTHVPNLPKKKHILFCYGIIYYRNYNLLFLPAVSSSSTRVGISVDVSPASLELDP